MLSVTGVVKTFGRTVAVAAANLEVADGELVCLLGPSGCGKSTLLRIIAGLAEADSGSICIAGVDATRDAANKRPTAMVFQSHALWSHMSVARNIAFGLRVRKLPTREIAAKVENTLELVGLKGYGARMPSQLSGGQAQRVALARCLVVQPKILLMDEPFSALDAHLRSRMREELKSLQRRLGIATVFVTHDQDEAMELADRIVVMNAGRMEQTGKPGELYASPRTEFVARFVGLVNFVPARVKAGSLDWLGRCFATRLPDADYMTAVRPEHLVQASGGVATDVERVIELGATRRLVLRVAGMPGVKLQASLPAGPDLAARLQVCPSKILVYRDGVLAETITTP